MKYGKRNEIKINPLAYNLMLIGESGIGKTTIINDYCKKLTNNVDDSYLFVEVGKEDGGEAINDLPYITAPEWDADYDETTNTIGFRTLIDDIVENKSADWKNLKVVVIDTIDELYAIAEPRVVEMHNSENPKKRVKSIKGAFGGFQGGEQKTVEIVLEALWDLKKVGVTFICVGHTKSRNQTDIETGQEYRQLTTNLPTMYFNAIKTKCHFLGVASIDREIVFEKTGKKNVVTNEDIKKGVVKKETRKITFRDDNYNIDSKCRFADIVSNIPFDVDELIKAITNAIIAEQSKSGVSVNEVKKKQEEEEKAMETMIAQREMQKKFEQELSELISQITSYFTENKTNLDIIKPILTKVRELGYNTPMEIDNIEHAKEVFAMTLK